VTSTALRLREQPLAFASFRLLRDHKVLLENDVPVRIGSRALDLLIALVERAGEVVGKNELMASAWPESVVEENNLRVHISALRKLLGDGERGARFIINVPGRGYSFVVPVTRMQADTAGVSPPAAKPASVLPIALTRVIGRDVIVDAIAAQLGTHRLVTLYGAGGIGKTTVSLAVADRLLGAGARVCFVDLAETSDSQQAVIAISAALGGPAPLEDPLSVLAAFLQQARLVLILDNCEHLIGAVAQIVERLLHCAPELRILATSRERLLAEGEQGILLPPLPCPDAPEDETPEHALRYPAVELFVERARAVHDAFVLTEQNVATVSALCRRLDGIPLALELVAARTGVADLNVLLQSIDQDLLGTSGGSRTGRRHQSLNATLDWSYRLLGVSKQIILRRLAVFCGLFSVAAARAVVSDTALDEDAVSEGLIGLLQRSLLVADTTGAEIRYRLLNVTRAFAASRLEESGEADALARRHANYHCRVMEGELGNWDTLSKSAWLANLKVEISDLRTALDWCFAPGGDVACGARLFVATLPLVASLSPQSTEERALKSLEVLGARANPDPVDELRVRTALVCGLVQSGITSDGGRERIEAAVRLARQIGQAKLMTEVLSGHAVIALEWAEYPVALQRFEVFEEVAKRADDAVAVLIADRLGAQVYHWAGDQKKARLRAERVLRHPLAPIPLVYGQSPVDRQVSMRIILARVAWLEGRAEDAREIAAEAIAKAGSHDAVGLSQALGFAACPIALWRGDVAAAHDLVSTMLEHARRHGHLRWYLLAQRYQHCLDGTPPLFDAGALISPLEQDLLGTLSMHWVDGKSIERAQAGMAGWCNPELLRVAGERQLQLGHVGAAAMADMRFRTALEYARGSGALAWELRILTSLSRLRAQEGDRAAAVSMLEPICRRFTQGTTTLDYRNAVSLLERVREVR
jgi:predicted ATPase/DNA-binding winged helix-turn-helix (wHTH) protein